ncbi:MAG: hypothetical protein CFH36_00133, partial [Alphaproteobacteria bacterium MarineAlpha9_Bin6]
TYNHDRVKADLAAVPVPSELPTALHLPFEQRL